MPAIRTWVFYAPHKLGAVVKSRFGEGDELSVEVAVVGHLCREAGIEASGFSPARWAFWEGRLEAIKSSSEKDLSTEVTVILDMMAITANDKRHAW